MMLHLVCLEVLGFNSRYRTNEHLAEPCGTSHQHVRPNLVSFSKTLGFVGLKGCCRLMKYVFKCVFQIVQLSQLFAHAAAGLEYMAEAAVTHAA